MKTLYIAASLIGAVISAFILWQEHRQDKRYKKQKEWLNKKPTQHLKKN